MGLILSESMVAREQVRIFFRANESCSRHISLISFLMRNELPMVIMNRANVQDAVGFLFWMYLHNRKSQFYSDLDCGTG